MISLVFRPYNFISTFQIYFSSYNLVSWVIYCVEPTIMKENRCKSIMMTETFCLICSKLPVRKILQHHQITWFQSLTILVLKRVFQICSLFFLTVNYDNFFLSFHNSVQKTIDDHLPHNNLQMSCYFPQSSLL